MSKPARHFYQFGPFRLDAAERLLLREGEPVLLTPKVFDTLLVLVQNSGRLLGKDELMQTVWPDAIVEESNLSQNIFTLRKALGESPTKPKYIETIPRRGYRFIASVREVRYEGADLTGVAVRSIAVLPFKPLGAKNGDEYLGLGLADALITRLSNIGQIVVRPTSSVRKYTGLEQDPVAVGRALRVESVLDGSLRRSGERIRVTVQLVSVRDGVPLWADRFDEKFTDIFVVEDSISERVAAALMLKLTGEDKKRLTKRYTENIEAFQLYLKGRYYWNKRTGQGLKKGIEYFQQAIEKDPTYALAYAGLADCYNLLSLYGVFPPKETMPRAKAAAMRALEIDNTLAEAHTSLAYAKLYYDWDWAGAKREFLRALELNPNYATAHHWYHEYLTAMGWFEESHAEILQAQELDPLSLIISTDVGWGLYYARRYDQAIEQLRKTIEMDPTFAVAHFILGLCYGQKGLFKESAAEIQKAIAILGDNPLALAVGVLGHAYAVSGKKDRALKVFEQLKDLSKRCYVPAYSLAIIYTGLGQKDQALKWLRKAYEERYDRLIYLKVEPMFDSLRSDPRFKDLLRRIGFA